MPRYQPKTEVTASEKVAYRQEVWGQVNRLLHVTRDEHERSLVLSMVAFAEECLCRLLRAFLRDVKATADLLEGFNAPLGTFSARIKTCYALGLLTETQFQDLELMRKIRNEFAHSWDECVFSDLKIKSWVDAIRKSPMLPKEPEWPESPERHFRNSVAMILFEVEELQHKITDEHKRLNTIAIRWCPPDSSV